MAKASSFTKICSVSTVTSELLKYEDAIRKLNCLQTNTSVLKEAGKQIALGNDRINNVKTTMKYLERAGVNIDHLNDKIIHVSGTKGKGSTAMLTESLLRSVPYKTGLFVSPHLTCVRERISINGSPLSLSTFVDYFWQVYNPLDQFKEHEGDMPTYFKFLTVMAYKVFTSENVDVAIVEVGVGGELDCTNVFQNTPIVGVTSIGLDHTAILGNTLEKIAWQKAGIMKPGCRAFTIPGHEESVLEVLESRALERKCQLEVVPELSEYSWDTSDLSYPKKLNASLALQLSKAWDVWKNNNKHLEYDKLSISEKEKKAIVDCLIFGRCQVIHSQETDTTYYLDGGHTVESIAVTREWFQTQCPVIGRRILIFNVTGNRNAKPLLQILKDCQFDEAIFCSNYVSIMSDDLPVDFIQTSRSVEGDFLIAKQNLEGWLSLECSPGSAVVTVAEALSLARKSGTHVLITGSLHLVGAALSLLQT